MTAYQLLRSNESLIRLLEQNQINTSDVTHLEIYSQFEQMKEKGHKVSYITVYLADKYKMTDRGIYKIIRRLNRKVNL
jgi:Mor family transcriptional regulator